jgi:hypothetical protein
MLISNLKLQECSDNGFFEQQHANTQSIANVMAGNTSTDQSKFNLSVL